MKDDQASGKRRAGPPGPGYDAYAPAEIAARIETAGCAKVRLAILPLFTLAVLAGAFIALGAMLYLVAVTGSGLGFGPTRLLGGAAFSLGLVLVLVGGAELFTGNSLIVMACADGRIGAGGLAYNWSVVLAGNTVGAVATAVMAELSGLGALDQGAVGSTARAIAEAKAALPFGEAFVRGVLCNVLVCLAVWLSFAAHDAASKILCIALPITAFVALGLEHSIANLFFFPFGFLLGAEVSLAGALGNLLPVTLGNVVGGGLLVGLVYWSIYRRAA